MQQTLTYFDVVLSHDHPAYMNVLHLTLTSAKGGLSLQLVKLTIVTLTILPIQIMTGALLIEARFFSLLEAGTDLSRARQVHSPSTFACLTRATTTTGTRTDRSSACKSGPVSSEESFSSRLPCGR